MPARIISSKIPNLSVPGPTVHTIFVRFIYPPKLNIYYCTSTEPSPKTDSIRAMISSVGAKHN